MTCGAIFFPRSRIHQTTCVVLGSTQCRAGNRLAAKCVRRGLSYPWSNACQTPVEAFHTTGHYSQAVLERRTEDITFHDLKTRCSKTNPVIGRRLPINRRKCVTQAKSTTLSHQMKSWTTDTRRVFGRNGTLTAAHLHRATRLSLVV